MKKLICLAVVLAGATAAGSALAGQAATNTTGDFVDLSVAVSPPIAGTPKAPRGVGISFDSFAGNRVTPNTPSATSSIVVRFNRGFKENGALFPSCRINLKALTKCSASTRVGAGTAEAQLLGSKTGPPTFLPAKLAIYNGKPLSGKTPTLIIIATLNGTPAAELDFTVKQQRVGPYGLAFSQLTPPPNSPPAIYNITKFSVSVPDRTVTRRVRGHAVKIHFVEAPTTCNGLWRFAQINTYTTAPTTTATDTQPCTRH